MKRAVLVATMAFLLYPAAKAEAAPSVKQDCWCVTWFARQYNADPGMDTVLNLGMMLNGVGSANRKLIRRGVYDWERGGYPSWCKDNPKACKALIACMIAAGGAVSVGFAKREDQADIAYDAVGACGTAVAAVYAVG